jgi:uncharacterized protein (TIGR02246 family)
MKTIYAVILCVLLLLVSACAQKVNDPADVQAIKKSMDDYVKAANGGDTDGVAAPMTDKTILALVGGPPVIGKAAIRSWSQAVVSGVTAIELGMPVEEVRVTGDLAVARGTWSLKCTPKAQGVAPIADGGSWTVVCARQNDRSWKWDWLSFNSSQPPPGSTATGEDERALYQIERDFGEALIKKDAAAMDKMLATEFQANNDSLVRNKKQFLAAIKSDTTKFESVANSEMRALVFGETAIVHGGVTVKSSKGGKDTSVQDRYTDVFVKRDGRWQCVSGSSTKVQQF